MLHSVTLCLGGRDGWNCHGRCPTNIGWDLVCPKFVSMAKTRGNTAAGTRASMGGHIESLSH